MLNTLKNIMSRVCPNCKDLIKDYEFIRDQAAEVYCHVSGCKTSYGNYYAKDIIAESDKYMDRLYLDIYRSDVADILEYYRNAKETTPEIALSTLICEIEEYFKIDEEYVKERKDRINSFGTQIVPSNLDYNTSQHFDIVTNLDDLTQSINGSTKCTLEDVNSFREAMNQPKFEDLNSLIKYIKGEG